MPMLTYKLDNEAKPILGYIISAIGIIFTIGIISQQ